MTSLSLGRKTYLQDTMKPIPPAGVVTSFNESARECLTWNARPETPEEQRKYRQSTLHVPGAIVKHFGTADDPVPAGPFGVKGMGKAGESTADYIKCYPDSEVARWKLDRAEDIYESSKREPLGKGYVRGHRIPDHLGTTEAFGTKIGAKEKDADPEARKIVFPVEQPVTEEEPQAHELYVKSHKAFAPGEQRRRNYDWDKTKVQDPAIHRFGALDKDNYRDGVAKALNPGMDPVVTSSPKVVSKIYDDFKATQDDRLGKPKPLGGGERNLSSDFVFGVPSMRHPEDGVDKLLRGTYNYDEQQPDADLGKSLREGWRNLNPDEKAFGVPSIRTDLPAPRAKSVSNTINYGNEPDALQLLKPPKSAERGINEEHYIVMRDKEEMRDIVAAAGLPLAEEEFDQIWNMSVDCDRQQDKCCLDTFMKVRHHILARMNGL